MMMKEFDSYSTAVNYAQRYGFAVFPLYGTVKKYDAEGKEYLACQCKNDACLNIGKHPSVSKGLKTASKDPVVLENLWAGRQGMNLAIATGVASGIFVVDIDGDLGRESLSKLPPLPETLTARTFRGHHYYFKYPDKKVGNKTHLWPNIDIRGEGGYVVAPPSNHYLGVQYEWVNDLEIAEAPQWLIDMICEARKAPVINEQVLHHTELRSYSNNEIRDMISYLDPDCFHEEWVQIGMAVHAGGYPLEIWDDWSSKSKKYKPGETTIKWRSFKPDGGITIATLIEKAQLKGWKPEEYISEPIDWDTHPAREYMIKLGQYKPPAERAPTPEPSPNKVVIQDNQYLDLNPRELPGIIGATVEWICGTATFPQPELALLNVITALGAVFGRRYASVSDLRTNIYACGIAGTTAGKDHSRTMIDKVMHEAGLATFLTSEDIKSTAGLYTQIEKQPSAMMQMDEFGIVLGVMNGRQAPGHVAGVSGALLKLFTSSQRPAMPIGTYASKEVDTVVLRYPNLCIYGTTTLSTFLDAMKRATIQDGTLNRFLIFPGREGVPANKEGGRKSRDVGEVLLSQWKALVPAGVEGLNKNLIVPKPKTVEFSGESEGYYDSLIDKQVLLVSDKSDGVEVVFGRYRELITKVAMIFAIARDVDNPRITMEDFGYAEKIVRASAFYIRDLAMDYMYDNEQERRKRDVMRIIFRNKGGIPRTELLRCTGGLKSKELDEIIKGLVEEERIVIENERTTTRTRIVYKKI